MDLAILIIWPSHNTPNFVNIIKKELVENQFTIINNKNITVSKRYVENILREIHYGKKWWDINIIPESNKRINNDTNSQNICYLNIKKNNIHLCCKQIKKYIRNKYKLDKSYFHISDPDCLKHLGKNCDCSCNKMEFKNETMKHVHFLTNKNNIHFLNFANYNNTYNFNTYLNKYKFYLNKHKLDPFHFCIDNGGILAAYGIRDTHDLDFLTLYNDNIDFNDKDVGCENMNHRHEYNILKLSIQDIINNPANFFYHFGVKFMSLNILKKFKYNRTHTIGTGHKKIRQKDINDFNLIQSLLSD